MFPSREIEVVFAPTQSGSGGVCHGVSRPNSPQLACHLLIACTCDLVGQMVVPGEPYHACWEALRRGHVPEEKHSLQKCRTYLVKAKHLPVTL